MLDVAARLRAGESVSDGEFDGVFTSETESVSFRHWTPVTVARRAARLLVDAGATEILDVGAGPGKLCIVGALTTEARFTGLEQRPHLVEQAWTAAAKLAAGRARFVHGNLLDFDCTPFDGFYFFNPFQEQIEDDEAYPIDKTIERSPELHKTYVASATAALIRAPVGTVVVTFHGLGGPMPSHYRCVHRERTFAADLAVWVREERAKVSPRGLSPPADDAPPDISVRRTESGFPHRG